MVDWRPVKKDKDEYGVQWGLKTGRPKVDEEDLDSWVYHSYKKVGDREPLVVAREDKTSELEAIINDLACTNFTEAHGKMESYKLSFDEVRLGFREDKTVFLVSQ